MASDFLSQDEVDALLKGVTSETLDEPVTKEEVLSDIDERIRACDTTISNERAKMIMLRSIRALVTRLQSPAEATPTVDTGTRRIRIGRKG